MKTILALVILTSSAFSQDRQIAITNLSPTKGQFELMKLKPVTPQSNEKQCGPYFTLLNENYSPNPPGIMFLYKGSDAKYSLIGLMSRSKFSTIIDDTKKAPTAEIKSNGTIDKSTKVIIRISKKDLDATEGCLPKP